MCVTDIAFNTRRDHVYLRTRKRRAKGRLCTCAGVYNGGTDYTHSKSLEQTRTNWILADWACDSCGIKTACQSVSLNRLVTGSCTWQRDLHKSRIDPSNQGKPRCSPLVLSLLRGLPVAESVHQIICHSALVFIS